MAKSTGLVLAAGGIAVANEIVFAPAAAKAAGQDKFLDPWAQFNWRLIPATLILAAILGGFETIAPDFATGLGGLVVLAVLVSPFGNAKSPLENVATTLGY